MRKRPPGDRRQAARRACGPPGIAPALVCTPRTGRKRAAVLFPWAHAVGDEIGERGELLEVRVALAFPIDARDRHVAVIVAGVEARLARELRHALQALEHPLRLSALQIASPASADEDGVAREQPGPPPRSGSGRACVPAYAAPEHAAGPPPPRRPPRARSLPSAHRARAWERRPRARKGGCRRGPAQREGRSRDRSGDG